MLPLLAVILGQFAVLAYLMRQYGQDRADMLSALLDDRAAHFDQTQILLQRIQAPEAAVVQHQIQAAAQYEPPPIATDDDTAFMEMCKTREELAAELLS